MNDATGVSLVAVLARELRSLETATLSVTDMACLDVALRPAVVLLRNIKLVSAHEQTPAIKVPILNDGPILVSFLFAAPDQVRPADVSSDTVPDAELVTAVVGWLMIVFWLVRGVGRFRLEFQPNRFRRASRLRYSTAVGGAASKSTSSADAACEACLD